MTTPQTLLRLAVAGFALTATAVQAEAPMASVEMLTGTCVACHGPAGNSTGPAIPSIAGVPASYMIGAMLSYKHGDDLAAAEAIVEGDPALAEDVSVFKRNPTIMNRIATGYTLDEIKAMAHYFEKQHMVPATQKVNHEFAERGKDLHADQCEKCHEEGGAATIDGMAALAGQWKYYIKYSLMDFHAGRRGMPKKMRSRLKEVHEHHGDQGLVDLVYYYASQQ